jgi:hypothetical protein
MINDKLATTFSYQRVHCSAIGRALQRLRDVAQEYNINNDYIVSLELFTVLFINVTYDGCTSSDVQELNATQEEINRVLAANKKGGMLMDHKTATGWGWFLFNSTVISLTWVGGAVYLGAIFSKRATSYMVLKRKYLRAFSEYAFIFEYKMGALAVKSNDTPNDELKRDLYKLRVANAKFTYQLLCSVDDYVFLEGKTPNERANELIDIMLTGADPDRLKDIKAQTKKFDCSSFTSSMKSVGRWFKRQFSSYGVVDVHKIIRSHILVLDKLITKFQQLYQQTETYNTIAYWGSVEVFILNNLLIDNKFMCKTDQLVYLENNVLNPYIDGMLADVNDKNINILFNYIHNFAETDKKDKLYRFSELSFNVDSDKATVEKLVNPLKQSFGLLARSDVYTKQYLKKKGFDSQSITADALGLVFASSAAATASTAMSGDLMLGQQQSLASMLLIDLGSSTDFIEFLDSLPDIAVSCVEFLLEVIPDAVSAFVANDGGGSLKYKKTTEKAHVLGRHRCVYKQGRKKYVKHKGQFTSLTQLLRHQNKYS